MRFLAVWQVEKTFGNLLRRLKLVANERMCKITIFQVLLAGQKWVEVALKHFSVTTHFYGSPQLLFVADYPSEKKQ